jgi:uncharacterized protein (TIGR00251 family)
MISLRETASGVTFAVRVQPRASRTAIAGILGEGDEAMLKIALAAPAIEGRANEALVRFLAKLLDVPRSAVEIVSGVQSRNKVVRIAGVSARHVQARLTV